MNEDDKVLDQVVRNTQWRGMESNSKRTFRKVRRENKIWKQRITGVKKGKGPRMTPRSLTYLLGRKMVSFPKARNTGGGTGLKWGTQ